MSMTRITPVEVRVRWDALSHLPRRLRIAGQDVPVTRIERVRREAQAYPADRGPRTVFSIRTPEARYSLVFEPQRRRWTVDGLESDPPVGDRVA